MANELIFGKVARQKIANGVKILSDAVRVTLGPRGRNVLIEQDFGAPLIINDGVTIAKNVVLGDKFTNLGASLIIEAATKTNEIAGDGTTTAIIMASECILKGLEEVDNGASPTLIKEGFEYYLPLLIDKICEDCVLCDTLEELEKVASLSSGSKEVGKLIKDAFASVGLDGEVSVEESSGTETYLDIVKGYSYDRGYASSYMVNNDQKMIAELTNALVLVTDKKLSSMKEILPFLEVAMKSGNPLLIVCDDIEQEVLSAIVMNKLRGVFNVVVTKAPSFGDRKLKYLKDIATITNATFVSMNEGVDLSKGSEDFLGSCDKAIISQNKTIIMGGHGDKDKVITYVDSLKACYDAETSKYEKDILKTRIAKLQGGIAVIKVGAYNEVELKDKKLRIEDALCATIQAKSSGTVEGGGKTLYMLSNYLEQFSNYPEALKILKYALKEPFYQILKNAGLDKDEFLPKLSDKLWVDASSKQIVSMRDSGIIDPTSVEIQALSNALSIAGIVLTTECAIIKNEEKEHKMEDLM